MNRGCDLSRASKCVFPARTHDVYDEPLDQFGMRACSIALIGFRSQGRVLCRILNHFNRWLTVLFGRAHRRILQIQHEISNRFIDNRSYGPLVAIRPRQFVFQHVRPNPLAGKPPVVGEGEGTLSSHGTAERLGVIEFGRLFPLNTPSPRLRLGLFFQCSLSFLMPDA